VLVADPAIILLTLVLGVISLSVSFFDPKGRRQAWLAWLWAKLILFFSGVRVRVEGLEHIDPNQSYVFIANHASYMDTPVILSAIKVQFRFLAKRGLFQIPLIGTHLSRAGHIPVPREDPRAAVKTMALAAEIIQSKKISLLIFPEGGRSHDGHLRPFKEGGVYIAIKAGVPLVPVALIGTPNTLKFGGGIVRSGEIILRIFPPVSTDELTLKDRAPVTAQLHDLLLSELKH
jgi:1-acyl-sn-glycerol-3-phosphate acyltransferase